jgi:hypothetical protein
MSIPSTRTSASTAVPAPMPARWAPSLRPSSHAPCFTSKGVPAGLPSFVIRRPLHRPSPAPFSSFAGSAFPSFAGSAFPSFAGPFIVLRQPLHRHSPAPSPSFAGPDRRISCRREQNGVFLCPGRRNPVSRAQTGPPACPADRYRQQAGRSEPLHRARRRVRLYAPSRVSRGAGACPVRAGSGEGPKRSRNAEISVAGSK